MTKRLCLATLFLFFAAALHAQAPLESTLGSVQPASAYELVRTLTKPEFGGRLTGDPGFTTMAKWAAGQFQSWGLKPLHPKTTGLTAYLQPFPTEYTLVERSAMSMAAPSGRETAFELNRDFLPLLFTDSGARSGEVVFTGWCISAPELGYDDYAGVDIRNKFVMCFRGTPDPADRRFQVHDEHRTRMKRARDGGALGLIYIYDEPIANPNGDWQKDFLPFVISAGAADALLKERGVPSATLRAELLKSKRPNSFELKMRVKAETAVRHVAAGEGYNIAGRVEGSDPRLKNEYIVIGGHVDHCGTQAGTMFPGANDNASGAAVVMEMARVVAKMKAKPKRSMLFVLFGGEEMGLKGSTYMAEHLADLPGKVVGMLNVDMAGEGDGAGASYSPEPASLKKALDDAGAKAGILRSSRPIRGIGVQGSDYGPFFAKGIPVISFSSNGPHLAYHQRGDTLLRINPDIMAEIARLGVATAYGLANQ